MFGGFEDRSADMTECLRLPPRNAPQNAESKAKIVERSAESALKKLVERLLSSFGLSKMSSGAFRSVRPSETLAG